MKKIFTTFVLLLATAAVWAYDVEVDGIYYNLNTTDKTAEVTFKGATYSEVQTYSGTVTIPETIESDGVTYSVASIGDFSFYKCMGLTSVTIPNSLTSIGIRAFEDCTRLPSINIPNSVTSIGERAFWNCSSLTSLSIPNSITSIDEETFGCCSGLTSLVIPNSVISIGYWAFDFCYRLTSITIPNSVTKISNEAFSDCYKLQSVVIPKSVIELGYVFEGCSSLSSIIVEEGNPKYDSRDNCNAIIETSSNKMIQGCKSTIIPNTVTSIGERAFIGSTDLTFIKIPNSVTKIENKAIANCSNLSSIIIPESVNCIEVGAFSVNNKLKSIVVEEGNTVYDSRDHCNALIKTSTNELIAGCINTVIPNGITSINAGAFADLSALKAITIPSTVESIGYNSFNGCSALTSVICRATCVPSIKNDSFLGVPLSDATLYVPESSLDAYKAADQWKNFGTIVGISDYDAEVDGIYYKLFEENKTAEVTFRDHKDYLYSGDISIPETITFNETTYTVTGIDSKTFYNCAGLTSVTVPKSVTSIGKQAFTSCYSLNSIVVEDGNSKYDSRGNCNAIIETTSNTLIAGCKNTIIPNSITSIKGSAFDGCSDLTSISIPASVTSIGDYAFSSCTNLTTVSCNAENVPTMGTNVFNDSNTGKATLIVPDASLESYANSVEWGVFGTIKGTNGTILKKRRIQVDDLYYNLDLETKTAEVTKGYSWGSYSGDIEIPDKITVNEVEYLVTSIGESAFSFCEGLTSVAIPNSVSSIGYSAFERSSSLTSIKIPKSVTSIGRYPFCNCSGLESLVVEEGNTVYDSRDNCNAIIETSTNRLIGGCKNTIIPNTVTTIGEQAFTGTTGLVSLTIPSSVTCIESLAFQNCKSLISLKISKFLTSIRWNPFFNCSGLTSIIVEEGNPVYDSRGNCNAIIETASNTLIVGCNNSIIPRSVNSIGYDAFLGCSGLTSININKSITSIAYHAFYGCSGLNSIVVEEGNPVYDSRGNCNALIETSSNTLFVGCKNTIIPQSVAIIGESAFSCCSNLTSVNIPSSVVKIGSYAFSPCSSLTSVTIGNSVTSIESWAFGGCNSLNTVICYAEDVPDMGYTVFGNINVKKATLYVLASALDAYKADYQWKYFGSILAIKNDLNGDVNYDKKVDVADATCIINDRLGYEAAGFIREWSDVNGDGQYTITDATAVVNIIFGEPVSSEAKTNQSISESLNLYRTADNLLALDMNNSQGYSSFQFDLDLPEGMSIEKMTLNQSRCKDFSLQYHETSTGHYKVVGFNFDNNTFSTGDGNLLTLATDGTYSDGVKISNIHFSTSRAKDVPFDDLTIGASPTGIENVNADDNANNGAVYNISGQRVETPTRGLYIINGKKVIKK